MINYYDNKWVARDVEIWPTVMIMLLLLLMPMLIMMMMSMLSNLKKYAWQGSLPACCTPPPRSPPRPRWGTTSQKYWPASRAGEEIIWRSLAFCLQLFFRAWCQYFISLCFFTSFNSQWKSLSLQNGISCKRHSGQIAVFPPSDTFFKTHIHKSLQRFVCSPLK